MKSIDLGRKMSESSLAVKSPEKDEVHYPTLYIDGVKSMPEFPDEGTMTVRFKKVGSSNNTDRKGNENSSCTLEIQEITDISEEDSEDDSQESNDRNRGDALDKLAEEESKNPPDETDESLPYERS